MCCGAGRFFEEAGVGGFYAMQLSPTCRYEVTRVLRFRNPTLGSSPIQSSDEVAIVPLKKNMNCIADKHSVAPPLQEQLNMKLYAVRGPGTEPHYTERCVC